LPREEFGDYCWAYLSSYYVRVFHGQLGSYRRAIKFWQLGSNRSDYLVKRAKRGTRRGRGAAGMAGVKLLKYYCNSQAFLSGRKLLTETVKLDVDFFLRLASFYTLHSDDNID